MVAHEFVQRVVDEAAAVGGAGVGLQRIQRAKIQDLTGIDRIGLAHPQLDPGDGKLSRARLERRARFRRTNEVRFHRPRQGVVERPPILLRLQRPSGPGPFQHRIQPGQPA